MAGTSYGSTGPIVMRNPGLLLDVHVAKGSTFTQQVGVSASTEQLRIQQLQLHASSESTARSYMPPGRAVLSMLRSTVGRGVVLGN
jgi:hypothetical protein